MQHIRKAEKRNGACAVVFFRVLTLSKAFRKRGWTWGAPVQ